MATLKQKKANPNSKYWRNKADVEVTKHYKGKPCKICGSTENTCGHHIVERSLSAYYRHHPANIIPLCQIHHTMGNDLAAHSSNPLAVKAFAEWLEANYPEGICCLTSYKIYSGIKVDYEQAYYEWKELNE